MDGLTIRCYGDRDECQYFADGWCCNFDRMCAEVHVGGLVEDGEE